MATFPQLGYLSSALRWRSAAFVPIHLVSSPVNYIAHWRYSRDGIKHLTSLLLSSYLPCFLSYFLPTGKQRLRAVGSCEHGETCSLCFLRLRALQRSFSCPTCKQDLETIVCTLAVEKFSSFTFFGKTINKPGYSYEEKSQVITFV